MAGLLLVGLFFVDYGPATTLSTVARWFALDGNPWSKLIGAILLVALGGVFGGIFGIAVGRQPRPPLQSILFGVICAKLTWSAR